MAGSTVQVRAHQSRALPGTQKHNIGMELMKAAGTDITAAKARPKCRAKGLFTRINVCVWLWVLYKQIFIYKRIFVSNHGRCLLDID